MLSIRIYLEILLGFGEERLDPFLMIGRGRLKLGMEKRTCGCPVFGWGSLFEDIYFFCIQWGRLLNFGIARWLFLVIVCLICVVIERGCVDGQDIELGISLVRLKSSVLVAFALRFLGRSGGQTGLCFRHGNSCSGSIPAFLDLLFFPDTNTSVLATCEYRLRLHED